MGRPVGERRRSVASWVCLAALLASPWPRVVAGGAAAETDDALFTRSLRPIEARIKAWDFAGAGEALAKLRFEPPELAERLATRRAEAALLAKLKAKMVAAINDAQPRLRKGTLLIPGLNGDLVRADEEAIAADVPGKGAEKHPWNTLSPRSVRRLIQRCADPNSADDRVASALLALMHDDVAGAEADFVAARGLGANVDRHIVPLADAELAKVAALIEQGKFNDVALALATLEGKYVGTPWLAARKEALAALRRRAKSGAADAEAETLYAEAARHFEQKDLVSLKPLVEKLKAQFAATSVVTDAKRKPSFADMAVAKLGKVLTVRQDGKGDFKTIQDAVNAAPPNGVVLVADGATYHEIVRIPDGKKGLVLHGKKGAWPTITSERFSIRQIADLVRTDCPDVTVEGFFLNHCSNENVGGAFACVDVLKPPVKVRSCILYMTWHGGQAATIACQDPKADVIAEFDHCAIALPRSSGGLWSGYNGTVVMTNCIWLEGNIRTIYPGGTTTRPRAYKFENVLLQEVRTGGPTELRSCTILGKVSLGGEPNLLRDCILPFVQASKRETTIEHCSVCNTPGFGDFAQPGKGCVTLPPSFKEPERFDYRLRPTSACRKKASDGGDLGCRYTPEMLEILQKALELREKGLMRF